MAVWRLHTKTKNRFSSKAPLFQNLMSYPTNIIRRCHRPSTLSMTGNRLHAGLESVYKFPKIGRDYIVPKSVEMGARSFNAK